MQGSTGILGLFAWKKKQEKIVQSEKEKDFK